MFNNAGISVLLDFHAAPGAQFANNAYAGCCVSTPSFWTQSNFKRLASAVGQLTTIIHNESANFGSVYGIEALNEPPTDGNATPGYASFLDQFVSAVHSAESALGVPSSKILSTVFMDNSWYALRA